MRGINSFVKDNIHNIVDKMFDKMTIKLLGDIPQLRNKKTILIGVNNNYTLANLFVSSLKSQNLLPSEEEALKSILSTAHSYIEALRNKTKADLTHHLDSYVMEQRTQKLPISSSQLKEIIKKHLIKSGKHINLIAGAEAVKTRNMGTALNIAKVGMANSEQDPNVFFVVLKDSSTCEECLRLHLMPDKITPRVWKLSEIGYVYHKKGENNPKISGLHVNCRCTLTYLAKGFGFKNGQVSYIGPDHNELQNQRS